MQARGDAFCWYGSTDMDLRAPLKRTKHPLSLSTMLKPGGHWEAKTALGHRAQKSEVQFLAFPIDLLVS